MARRKPAAKTEGAGVDVRAVAVNTRALVTMGEGHPVWKGVTIKPGAGPWDGAIVRLRPPPDVKPERIEQVKKVLANAGVARIKLEVQRGATLPIEAVEKAKPAKRSSAREVVLQLVAEANSADAEGLKVLCERVMAEEGL